MVLILESRSHLDLGDLPNLLAAELGVMTVRLERAIRSLDGVARVHVNRWGDGSAHLHMWFLARPYGRLQLRGTFLSLWDSILPPISESQWRENLAMVAAWLAEFGGRPLAEPPRIQWQAPSSLSAQASREKEAAEQLEEPVSVIESDEETPVPADDPDDAADAAEGDTGDVRADDDGTAIDDAKVRADTEVTAGADSAHAEDSNGGQEDNASRQGERPRHDDAPGSATTSGPATTSETATTSGTATAPGTATTPGR
ncbi:hypothetical protein AB0F73_30175 [Micromonospora purpureochromogenes]|uniref:hypothetical protein n=1 Tax=Micromonospora purpureochromogenes TaxID=47872 RepID=UPI0033D1E928